MIGFIVIIAFLLLSIGVTAVTCYLDTKRPAAGGAFRTNTWRLYM